MDIELRNVDADAPLIRKLSANDDTFTEEHIETDFGTIMVAKQGADHNASKPVIITYHDIGLNHASNFQAFFNYIDMQLLLQSFAVFHINAPGQEENSSPLPNNYNYPTMDQLAEQIGTVCAHYGIKNFIGFGVGAGANILCRYALKYPSCVDGLFLINCTSCEAGWTEWLYQKINCYYLNSSSNSFPQSTQEYLMWHHFGKITPENNRDIVEVFRKYFSGKSMNGRNLAYFINSYLKRTDLGLVRGQAKNFKCPVLLLCGSSSPHVEDSVTMNCRLNPFNSNWMKLSDCGMALEEQPGKVAEALKLFIQGIGYALTAYERRRSSLRKLSLVSTESFNGSPRKSSLDDTHLKQVQEVHIVENPIAQC